MSTPNNTENATATTATTATPAQTPVRPTAPAKGKRGKNFSIAEDKQLCYSWLNTSVDPVVGTDQRSDTLWARIHADFKEKMEGTERNMISLVNRWSTIQSNVSSFCGSLAKIDQRNQSGTVSADRIDDAKELFNITHGSIFMFEHCWKILKEQPKWSNTIIQRDEATRARERRRAGSSEDGNGFGNDAANERPMGRKQGKDRMATKRRLCDFI